MTTVYADNAASTQLRPEVSEAMDKVKNIYANPSSCNFLGKQANELIEDARCKIAETINAAPEEIVFTSGGTEANNLALRGFLEANNRYGNHIITTCIEHSSVYETAKYLQTMGYNITYLSVDSNGVLDIYEFKRAIKRSTILISVMMANNEIGSLQPIEEIGDIAQYYSVPFHTDAVQGIGHCQVDVRKQNIDMMSISAHKFYGPKGVGALYVRKDMDMCPLMDGAGQEYGLRSGTENVQGIVGFSKAVELLDRSMTTELRDKFIDGVLKNIPETRFNGSKEKGLPGIANISFLGVDQTVLLSKLNEAKICASAGYRWSDSQKRVLRYIGTSDVVANSAVRFSFGHYNTQQDVDYILGVLPGIVNKIKESQ